MYRDVTIEWKSIMTRGVWALNIEHHRHKERCTVFYDVVDVASKNKEGIKFFWLGSRK